MGAGINHHRNDSNDSIYMRIPIPSYTHLKESVLKADSGSSSAAAAAARKSSGKPQLKQQLVGAWATLRKNIRLAIVDHDPRSIVENQSSYLKPPTNQS